MVGRILWAWPRGRDRRLRGPERMSGRIAPALILGPDGLIRTTDGANVAGELLQVVAPNAHHHLLVAHLGKDPRPDARRRDRDGGALVERRDDRAHRPTVERDRTLGRLDGQH